MKSKETRKSKDKLWRVVFGILFVIFALIALSRFNSIAALLYLILSIFIFIPGNKFKIPSKRIKVGIVIIALLGVGLINQLPSVSGPKVEEYALGQEFLLPNDPNFALTVTQAVREQAIMVKEQEYLTDESFLLVYLKTRFAGDMSTLPADNTVPFSMSFVLKDSDDNEYVILDMDTKEMPQAKALLDGESLYLYNIPKNATGLKLIFTARKYNKFAVVDLGG